MSVPSSAPLSAGPARTCVGCGRKAPARDLVAIVRDGGSFAAFAPGARGRALGRSAHAHPTRDCLGRAEQKGLSRSFRTDARAPAGTLLRAARAGLAARRDELLRAAQPGAGPFVVVATDAGPTALAAALPLVPEGRAVVAGTSRSLARRGAPVEVAHLLSAARFSELRGVVERLSGLSEGLA